MKADEIKPGMKVVSTKMPTATVYTVKGVSEITIKLAFVINDKEIDAGTLDVRFLELPTQEQLINA